MSKQRVATVFCTYTALVVLLPLVFSQPADPVHPGKQAVKNPVKVFILAGQSNMEGYGAIHEVDKAGGERKGTLTYLLDDPSKAPLFKHLRDDRPMPVSETITIEATNSNFGDPAPNRIKKLWVEYTLDSGKQQQKVDEGETLTISAKPGHVTIEKAFYGDFPDGDKRDVTEEVKNLIKANRTRVRWKVRDDVWVWFNDRKGGLSAGFGANKDLFGPELQFGNVLGDAFDNQVLIIKTAWGGKSLYKEFRPPSSGGEIGPCYLQMIETVNRVLANLKTEFPGYDNGGYELSGLVWWHGWNDGCDPKNAVPEYKQNLVNLIKDLRKDLRVPKLPVVVGELTGPWVEAPDEWATLRQAQAVAAAHPEFQGNVLFVPTHDFVRKEEDSPGGWPAHEFNNAETYFLVGNALGEAMKKLLGVSQPGAKPGPSTPLSYTDRNIEGWTVRISDQLMETEREATMKAIELLTAQLSEIVRVVPAQALAVLRSVPLWVSPLYPEERQPRAEYHPDAGWLRDHGRDPAMAKAVEFTNVSIFEAETRRMPNFALHELAHAYHDRVLSYDHPEIKDAYGKAKAAGRYDRIEQRFGDGRTAQARAYAMTDPQEYFAECTEAFFSTNDFFPFTRNELKQHDPEMFNLLAKIWGTETNGNNPSTGPLSHISSVQAGNYYVAIHGNDANPGTLAKPFATIHQAQQAARKSAGREAVTIFIREGTYYLPETWIFTAEDSGTKAAPIVYQAFEKEKAVISGGIRLKDLQWEPYQDGIMQTKVPAGFTTDQLFVNGERQPMARYPNFDPKERHFNGWAKDAFSPERAARWKNPAGGFIHALHAAEWGGMHYVITGKGPDNKITYEGGWQNNRPMGMHEIRFVENIFEELDAPGEWFLDPKTSTLYFFPPIGVDLVTAAVEAVHLKHLIEFRGTEQAPVRFVSFKGLTFRRAARTFMENKEPLVRSDWTTYRGGAIFYTGSEDCSLEDCFIDQVGGNAVFVNNYNRRVTIRGCHIAKAGANGVAFVGDRDSARVPRDWNDHSQSLETLDRTPGPKTANYPADCLVDDCLIYLSGRVEKQTAPVQIELSQGITVRHCSLYDVPRAGINIGDGCWGGHVIEFCDIFDTVKETGDHGSFNSWGRDRFWRLAGLDLNNDQAWEANKDVILLDAVNTTILRNNRWRCDHGWDIDLDDGSSNYHIYNNLCLNGGLKNREGFYRVVENNIIINGFHPHVWYKHSEDIIRRNIMFIDHYLPAGGMPANPWGKEMDNNFVHVEGVTEPEPAAKLAEQSRRDEHSIVADAMFVDPANGDFRVKEGSLALKLGFVNFPMDQFGVQKSEFKAIARTPQMPKLGNSDRSPKKENLVQPVKHIWQAEVRNISGLGDRSAYGLPDESGVLLLNVPAGSPAAKAGFQKDDVILACNGQPVRTVKDLLELRDQAAGTQLSVSVNRKQKQVTFEVTDYEYVVAEHLPTPDFKLIPLIPSTGVLPAKLVAGEPHTSNEPIDILTDGKLAKGYGPVFPNNVTDGMYKLDLGAVKSIAQVDTFSYNQNNNRGRQRFALYGSSAMSDPGWKVEDARVFTPLVDLDTGKPTPADFVATSIRCSGGRPLGNYRWLVWAVFPVTQDNVENTAFQELQVIPER